MDKVKPNILVIIPARGGSKGIPRKNLRSLAGRPLIYYSIWTALGSKFKPDVYVSTDDQEIATIAKKLGVKIIHRDASKAMDETTLDPVIFDGFLEVKDKTRKNYDLIVTLQPTSPLLKSTTLDAALERIARERTIDTIISAKDDTHLTWTRKNGYYAPNYTERVNRQFLNPVFKETGGFLITRSTIISKNNRIGSNVELYLLQSGEDIDIDTYEDWNICEYYLRRKKILFVVSGHHEIGLGHVYNTLLIANDIMNHDIEFLVDDKSRLAYEKIVSKNYTVHMQENEDIVEDIRRLAPQVVINDRLDTSEDYMATLKQACIKLINFEDLGAGARFADIVINAIYPEREILPRHYFGHRYFILRDEFLLTSAREITEQVGNVLLTFGGVDPNNYTRMVIDAIYPFCAEQGIKISVVAGFGYSHYETLEPYHDIKVFSNSMNIAEHMSNADIIFTSAGRTAYEVAAMRVPSIVLAQNERELTHLFATAEHGFLNLGLGSDLSEKEIYQAFTGLVKNYASRKYMSKLMGKCDLFSGRRNVHKLIKDIVEQA